MKNIYPNTVSGGLDERRGKFALAEGLAVDISPTEVENDDGDTTLRDRLLEAREALIKAGADAKSAGTLAQYRRTALWASNDLKDDFGWVDGRSWSSHDEARKSGLTFDQYVELDEEEAKVDALRERSGRKTTHAGTITDGVIDALADGNNDELLREIADNPEIIEAMTGNPELLSALVKSMGKPEKKQETHDTPRDPEVVMALKLQKAVYDVESVVEWLVEQTDDIIKQDVVMHNDRAQRLQNAVATMLTEVATIPDDLSALNTEDVA